MCNPFQYFAALQLLGKKKVLEKRKQTNWGGFDILGLQVETASLPKYHLHTQYDLLLFSDRNHTKDRCKLKLVEILNLRMCGLAPVSTLPIR